MIRKKTFIEGAVKYEKVAFILCGRVVLHYSREC